MTRYSLLALAALVAVPTLTAGAHEASADVAIRIGGRVRIGGAVRVRTPRVYWGWRPHRVYYRPYRVFVGGVVYIGGGYYEPRWAAPPPPPPAQGPCECGPSYYPPVAPAPTTVYAAPAPEKPLARLGIGAFVGGVDVEDQHAGDDVGLLARLRLTRGFHIEGEIAESELAKSHRTDRRLGGALIYELGAQHSWAPYLLLGTGVTQAQVDRDWVTTQSYGEIGAGLRWALTERFHLAFDFRAGTRAAVKRSTATADGMATPYSVVPPGMPPDEGTEDFTRGRLSALLYF